MASASREAVASPCRTEPAKECCEGGAIEGEVEERATAERTGYVILRLSLNGVT